MTYVQCPLLEKVYIFSLEQSSINIFTKAAMP